MGRGSSKIGGGGASGGAVADKPFDANDWRTWPVGTQVDIVDSDVAVGDGVGAKVSKTFPGVVTAVFDDHIIVTDTKTNTQNWIDADTVDIIKRARKPK